MVEQAEKDKVFHVYLEEYRQCRDEVKTYTGRTDYILIIYMTALLGIIVFFFNCDDPLKRYNTIIYALKTSTGLSLSLLSVTILQALLSMLISNYAMFIYRSAKYTSTYLRNSIAELLNVEPKSILSFEIERHPEDNYMLLVRAVTVILWTIISHLINLIILISIIVNSNLTIPLYLATGASVLLNSSAIGISFGMKAFYHNNIFDLRFSHAIEDQAKKLTKDIRNNVIIATVITIIFYVISIVVLLKMIH